MIENLILMFEGLLHLAREVFVYGGSAVGGVGGLYILYKAGNWLKRL